MCPRSAWSRNTLSPCISFSHNTQEGIYRGNTVCFRAVCLTRGKKFLLEEKIIKRTLSTARIALCNNYYLCYLIRYGDKRRHAQRPHRTMKPNKNYTLNENMMSKPIKFKLMVLTLYGKGLCLLDVNLHLIRIWSQPHGPGARAGGLHRGVLCGDNFHGAVEPLFHGQHDVP